MVRGDCIHLTAAELIALRPRCNSLRLPMSRTDIGNYLGITLETVCRELARLEKNGIISLHKRELNILDLPRLRDPICEEPK